MKTTGPLSILFLCIGLTGSVYAATALVTVYECTDETNHHKTFQDTTCNSGQDQQLHEYGISQGAPSDYLRPYELVMLERFNQMDNERFKSTLELKKEYSLAEQQYNNAIGIEKLRFKQGLVMFDKNYRHFWAYTYNNGGNDNPFLLFGPRTDNLNFPTTPAAPATPISSPPAIPTPGPTVPGTPP